MGLKGVGGRSGPQGMCTDRQIERRGIRTDAFINAVGGDRPRLGGLAFVAFDLGASRLSVDPSGARSQGEPVARPSPLPRWERQNTVASNTDIFRAVPPPAAAARRHNLSRPTHRKERPRDAPAGVGRQTDSWPAASRQKAENSAAPTGSKPYLWQQSQ